MRLICGPEQFALHNANNALRVMLYGQPLAEDQGSAGEAVQATILRQKLEAAPRAWDLLSIALSVVAADGAGRRSVSPDGWTREFELDIAVADPAFWATQAEALASALSFLTTDIWRLRFHGDGFQPTPPKVPDIPDEDCVVLLSGGLDSLIGAIDLCASGKRPLAVSQRVRGDSEKQAEFASLIGGGLRHLQLNHNAAAPGIEDDSQRARSFIFIAFAVLAATTLKRYRDGKAVDLYLCENGFIAINPPLTGGRIGSLSTRTAHPEYLSRLQDILTAAGLRVIIQNPYQTKTKGEMLRDCLDQDLLKKVAAQSTSCGRFQRFGYRQCGRCVPCQVRRGALLSWAGADSTDYVYENLGRNDSDHSGFDDVRSVAMALVVVDTEGFESWLGTSLSSPKVQNRTALLGMLKRGLEELRLLHKRFGVK